MFLKLCFRELIFQWSWFGHARKWSNWIGFRLLATDGGLSDQDVVCVRRRDGHSWWIQALTGIIWSRRLPRDLVSLAVNATEALISEEGRAQRVVARAYMRCPGYEKLKRPTPIDHLVFQRQVCN